MATTNFVDRVTPINASWLNDVDAATYEGAGTYTPAGTGAVARTIQSKLRDIISVKDFGAVGDAVADDTAAIQAALDASAAAGGGRIYFPAGTYIVTATLTTGAIAHLIGDGANTSFIQVNHTSGPGVTFTRYFSGIQSIGVRGSSARLAAAAGTNYGVFFPTDSTVAQSRFANYVRDCQITNHPSHGVYATGQGMVVEDTRIIDIGGHGFYGDNFDAVTSYVFGFCEIKNTQFVRCTGHAVCAGVNRATFRVTLDNVDASHCALTAGVRQSAHTIYMVTENLIVRNCGIGGWSGDSPSRVLAIGGLYVNGREPLIENNRFIDVLGNAVTLGPNSDGARVIDPHVTGEVIVALDPAVVVESGCTGVYCRSGFPANITKVMTVAASNTGNSSESLGLSPQAFRSARQEISLADDAVTTFTFSGITRGILALGNSNSVGEACLVAFRVGDGSAYCTLMTNATNVNTATGVLTGTTGTDTKLTISAGTASSTLYIENRRGSTLALTPTFLSLGNGEMVL